MFKEGYIFVSLICTSVLCTGIAMNVFNEWMNDGSWLLCYVNQWMASTLAWAHQWGFALKEWKWKWEVLAWTDVTTWLQGHLFLWKILNPWLCLILDVLPSVSWVNTGPELSTPMQATFLPLLGLVSEGSLNCPLHALITSSFFLVTLIQNLEARQ